MESGHTIADPKSLTALMIVQTLQLIYASWKLVNNLVSTCQLINNVCFSNSLLNNQVEVRKIRQSSSSLFTALPNCSTFCYFYFDFLGYNFNLIYYSPSRIYCSFIHLIIINNILAPGNHTKKRVSCLLQSRREEPQLCSSRLTCLYLQFHILELMK